MSTRANAKVRVSGKISPFVSYVVLTLVCVSFFF